MAGNKGLWVNYVTDEIFDISEHETWMRSGDNAKKLGIADWAIDEFKNYVPQEDRLKFLLKLIDKFPIMRVREHGTFATFEFSSYEVEKPLKSIAKAASHLGFGQLSGLYIINFANREEISIRYGEFLEKYEDAESMKELTESFEMNRLSPGLVDLFSKNRINEGVPFKLELREFSDNPLFESINQ